MLHVLDCIHNEKVELEIRSIEKTRVDLFEKLQRASTVSEYLSSFLKGLSGLEMLDKIQTNQRLKILDIGFGRGETSLYLKSQGHDVHAVEPSLLNCQLLQAASRKYDLPISIYQGTIEHFDQIEEQGFDLCLFNSSLHHCDDPLKAVSICREKLNLSGRVIALNEPILKFYRSKKWFFKRLEQDPISLGHYGGNEHIYYYSEYIQMFKNAGFESVEGLFHIKYQHPRIILLEDILRKVDGKYVHSDKRVLFKFCVFLFLKNLYVKPVIKLGKRLSLFSFSFEAKKNSGHI